MNNNITKYPTVSDKRLEEKIKGVADKENVSIFLELAYLREKQTMSVERALLAQTPKAVEELERRVKVGNNNIHAWKGLKRAKAEGFIGGLQVALFYIRKYIPTKEVEDDGSKAKQ